MFCFFKENKEKIIIFGIIFIVEDFHLNFVEEVWRKIDIEKNLRVKIEVIVFQIKGIVVENLHCRIYIGNYLQVIVFNGIDIVFI